MSNKQLTPELEKAEQVSHTNGPWRVVRIDYPKGQDVSFEILSNSGELIAQTIMREIVTEPGAIERDEANANLIAAAPELLLQLRNLVDLASVNRGRLHEYAAALQDARELMARAEGRS